MNLQLFFPKDSDVDQSKIIAKMRANQTILNTPTSSPEAKATAVKILQDLSTKYGDVSQYAQGALGQTAPAVQPTSQAAAQVTPTTTPAQVPQPLISSKTASEQGLNPEAVAQLKENPFYIGVDLPPKYTSRQTPTQSKLQTDLRNAFLQSSRYKMLDEQYAGAEEARKFVDFALDNPAKTGALEPIANAFLNYANALKIPLTKEEKQQLVDYARADQADKAILLAEQILQKGPQTESDATRIAQATFNTKMSNEARRAAMVQYLDAKINPIITRKRFTETFLSNENTLGQESMLEQAYGNFLRPAGGAPVPESVFTPKGKVVSFDEAAKALWSDKPELKPSKGDSQEEILKKHNLTVKYLRSTDRKQRAKYGL